jgi:hypothetical protein
MSQDGGIGSLSAATVAAPQHVLAPLLETTRPFAPPGSSAGQTTVAGTSQLALGNPGGVHQSAGAGITTDNVA